MPRFYYLKRPRTISDFLLFPCLFHFSRYKSLIGGEQYEPDEENPMIGFRGCGRYTDPFFEECFAMELEVRQRTGSVAVKMTTSCQEHYNLCGLVDLGSHFSVVNSGCPWFSIGISWKTTKNYQPVHGMRSPNGHDGYSNQPGHSCSPLVFPEILTWSDVNPTQWLELISFRITTALVAPVELASLRQV